MKNRIVLYALLAMTFQVVLGQITKQGQGSIGVLLFILFVELDPKYSFKYLIQKVNTKKDKE